MSAAKLLTGYFKHISRQRLIAIISLIAAIVVGWVLLWVSLKASTTTTASIEPENATLSGGATAIDDSTASGNKSIKFGQSIPSSGSNCSAYPDFPDANCTGWQHTGITLSNYAGPTDITTSGTVIDGKLISSDITISASNVTIERSQINGVINITQENYSGILLTDLEINGQNNKYFSGVNGGGFHCLRCNVYNVTQGFRVSDNTTVEDSYVHDLYGWGDPAATGSHNEAYLSNGGSNNTVVHNNFDASFNSASSGGGMSSSLSFYGDFSQVSNVLVQNNLFNADDGYCVYAGSVTGKAYPLAKYTRFIGNIFGRKYTPQCGGYGAVTAYDGSGVGNQWTDNTWGGGAGSTSLHSTGSPVIP